MDAHLSTPYDERRRFKLGDLTEGEKQRVVDEINDRIDAGENLLIE